MKLYGHRQLGLYFKKALEITSGGFIHKGKNYIWNDIKHVEIKRGSFILNAFMFPAGMPKANILLSDNRCIKINGRALEVYGEPTVINKINGESQAYTELLQLIKDNTNGAQII
jgi:hypothetical protein